MDLQDVLVGVASSYSSCPTGVAEEQHPASYTRLGPHYQWLLDVTSGTTHCVPHKIFRDHHRRRLVAANRLQD